MGIFSKILKSSEQAESIAVEQAVSEEENSGQIFYAARLVISNRRFCRICHDLPALETVLRELLISANVDFSGDCSDGRLSVYADGNADLISLCFTTEDEAKDELASYRYFSVPVNIACVFYTYGFFTPGYLYAWDKNNYSIFPAWFLNMLGLADSNGGYSFTVAELDIFIRYGTSSLSHELMFKYLCTLEDTGDTEVGKALEYLSDNDDSYAEQATLVIDALATSPAFKSSMGDKEDLLGQVDYLSKLDVYRINRFQSIFLFIHKINASKVHKTLFDTLKAAEEDAKNSDSFDTGRPCPLWLIQKIESLRSEYDRMDEIIRLLESTCSKIEAVCKNHADDKSISTVEQLLEGTKRDKDISSSILNGITDSFDRTNPSFLQRVAGAVIQSGYFAKYPIKAQEMTDQLIGLYPSPVPDFTLAAIKDRMPELDNLSRLYVLSEKGVITDQVNKLSEKLSSLKDNYDERLAAGLDAFVLSSRIEDTKEELDRLQERETLLLELAGQLEEYEKTDRSAHAATLKRLAEDVFLEHRTLSEDEKHVLSYYGLSEWWYCVFPTDEKSLDESDFKFELNAWVQEILRQLADILDHFIHKDFYFLGWGYTPDIFFIPSVNPCRYDRFTRKLYVKMDKGPNVHPVFHNKCGHYANEFDYIQSTGPFSAEYSDSPERYTRLLGQLTAGDLPKLENLFSNRDSFRKMCGSSLIRDGFRNILEEYIYVTKEIQTCTSIFQRDLLHKRMEKATTLIAEKASTILQNEVI